MEVKLIDHMGTDLSVVNAARISFGKRKEVFDESDEKLIRYLAKHNHFTPFCHNAVTFYIKVPIFVARQLAKHQVGLTINEESRRYLSNDPEFYTPPFWRGRSEDGAKQGSSTTKTINYDIYGHNIQCLKMYENMLSEGIAPEMARMVLPQNMFTSIYWTGSLYAFARVYRLRTEKTAQWETQQVAKMIGEECEKLYPVSWKALTM
jgi:thymidylate synthase (FAD)